MPYRVQFIKNYLTQKKRKIDGDFSFKKIYRQGWRIHDKTKNRFDPRKFDLYILINKGNDI